MKMKLGMPKEEVAPKESEAEEPEEMDEWEVKSAADAFMKVEEIKKNQKLMPLVMKEIESRKESLNKITSLSDLKKIAKQKQKED